VGRGTACVAAWIADDDLFSIVEPGRKSTSTKVLLQQLCCGIVQLKHTRHSPMRRLASTDSVHAVLFEAIATAKVTSLLLQDGSPSTVAQSRILAYVLPFSVLCAGQALYPWSRKFESSFMPACADWIQVHKTDIENLPALAC
jgi:hypothetical protein